ncbi:hypothetical protein [Lactobacillus crispatus]|jgi:hypothetical protein|uniref:hypothetical protein n=1 Tax=Lactobacillus crispatus TaxID=47770 RepID=UPI000E007BBE|nr:hypothetical protein [Lactobacillus crispatus]STX18409.1 Uncharacterised protein [Lactobacillus acidophilus]MCT7807729.1 hypothetical protein [Lactobacillus crispatus]MCT7816111.1 hypothetical protein [Lactobacillus crispatus]MDX5105165.1 hypothetical protein [Lactobacillus crispatus]NJJ53458.1 hypothetical protein [Lactobacillus crispatus]
MKQQNHYNFWSILVSLLVIFLIIFALLYVFKKAQVGTTNALTEPQKADVLTKIWNAFFQHLF